MRRKRFAVPRYSKKIIPRTRDVSKKSVQQLVPTLEKPDYKLLPVAVVLSGVDVEFIYCVLCIADNFLV